MKIAAIEAEWQTTAAPASFTVFGIPDTEGSDHDYAVRIPWVLGLIATRSMDKPVLGIDDLVQERRSTHPRRHPGLRRAADAASRSRMTPRRARDFRRMWTDLGYALLLRSAWRGSIDSDEATSSGPRARTVPPVGPLFWSFRIMVGLGFLFILMFAFAFYVSATPAFRSLPLIPAARVLSLAAALDRRRTRLDRGGSRATALGDRWRIAHALGRIQRHAAARCSAASSGFVLFYSILAVVDIYPDACAMHASDP